MLNSCQWIWIGIAERKGSREVTNTFIQSIVETSIIAGAFIYLLKYMTTTLTNSMNASFEKVNDSFEKISINMKEFGKELGKIATTLLKIDMRVEKLEDEVRYLKERGDKNG